MLKLFSIQLPRRVSQWFKALFAAIISGMANSFLNAVGASAVNATGLIKIEQYTPKQLLDMTIVGGLVGMFLYLKQSPVPPDSSGDTVTITKQKTQP